MSQFGGSVTFTSDDVMWVAKPPIQELFGILYDPVAWVANYVRIKPDCSTPARPARVESNYSISFEAIDLPKGSDPSKLTVQGIDRTNILTIRVPSDGALYYIYDTLLSCEKAPIPNKHNPDLEYCMPSSEYLAHVARVVVRGMLKTDPPTIQNVAKDLFHGKSIDVTICDKNRAYAHMPLVGPGVTINIAKSDEGEVVSRSVAHRVMVTIYHLIAAGWSSIVEDSFNGCNRDSSTQNWKIWQDQEWINDPSPGYLDLNKCFTCRPGIHPPMTITGCSPTNLDAKDKGKAKSNYLLEAILAPTERDDLSDEETCEVLVAEYQDGNPNVTWSDAFSKVYTQPTPPLVGLPTRRMESQAPNT